MVWPESKRTEWLQQFEGLSSMSFPLCVCVVPQSGLEKFKLSSQKRTFCTLHNRQGCSLKQNQQRDLSSRHHSANAQLQRVNRWAVKGVRWISVYAHVCMLTPTHTASNNSQIYICAHTNSCMAKDAHICMCACTHTWTSIHYCPCTCVFTFTHFCIGKGTHTCTHVLCA